MKKPCKHYATKLLIAALVKYIRLLGRELNDVVGIAHVHGWRSTRVEQGQKTRARIKELCQIVYGKDMKWVK